MFTPRQREPYRKGRAYLYFFPDGHTERAIVRLNDGDDFYSLVVHPLTGRVEVMSGKVDIPRDFGELRRRGQGDARASMRTRGFTLLEVMIAMAILSGALVWMVVGVSRNIKAENHAKLMTTANFLAREKMVDIEDDLYDKGFGEFEKEQAGAFDDKGFSRFAWKAIVDKVELPSADQLQTVLSNAQQARQTLQGGGPPAGSDPSQQQRGGRHGRRRRIR